MIEVSITYDLLPDIDQTSYGQFLRKGIVPIFKQPGIVEIRAYRSLSGPSQGFLFSSLIPAALSSAGS